MQNISVQKMALTKEQIEDLESQWNQEIDSMFETMGEADEKV